MKTALGKWYPDLWCMYCSAYNAYVRNQARETTAGDTRLGVGDDQLILLA